MCCALAENFGYFISRKDESGALVPGMVSEVHFWLLVEISAVRSKKVIKALMDYFVNGYARSEACIRNDVSESYFSISLNKITRANVVAELVSQFYLKNTDTNTGGE
ncbi:transcriptional regulator [Salmonella enterica]|nr:transcriptional regulator [Salmonella enterica]ECT8453123.1 transcriptional regulator [Salmonella enterica subsp. enterica serovar Thompson]ECW3060633.1 transcriptional regulator [Salmonella enterica subsp. enterica serovar Thompson]EIV7857249.1 transcriptional regulator [Salmonella enterica]